MKSPLPKRLFLCALIGLLPAWWPASARAATPKEVDDAIDNAKGFLYKQFKPNGECEPQPQAQEAHNWGGYTALATYALLAAGESNQDPRLAKAIQWLARENIVGTYAVGLRAQIWNLIPNTVPNWRQARDRDALLLLNSIGPAGQPDAGLYDYSADPKKRIPPRHNSPSQYGVLGMWALEESGYEVPDRYWELVEKAWKGNQANDGGWSYLPKPTPDQPVKASMTAAGVASLFVTQDFLLANRANGCKGNIKDKDVEAGLNWMSRNFAQVGGDHYTLYGVERIGVASGYKYFGKTDWYAVGSETLVRSQGSDGRWDGAWGTIPSTSFGLLFLVRGRAPVALNKLDYEIAAANGPTAKPVVHPAGATLNWNERPRDAANWVRWAGRNVENHDLNWQIVNLLAPVEELHDAPILYIAGNGAIAFTPEEQAKLRLFVEQGGMILGNADCANKQFTESFKKLGKALFPKYEFRQLPTNHVVFTHEQFKPANWRNKPKIDSLSNGTRELMMVIPEADPSRAWQTRSDKTKKELYEVMSNIFLYSVDEKNLQSKGNTYIIADKGVAPARTVNVARLMAGDNPDPEPGGWRRLANLLKNEDKTALVVEPVTPDRAGKINAKIVHLTGTTNFTLNAATRAALKQFVDGGGTLVVDAAGGSVEFADAAEKELAAIFGEAAAKSLRQPLPAKHLVYNVPGHPVTEFRYRRYLVDTLHLRGAGPRIAGITVGDRVGVFYSREDLSTGLVGQPVDGVIGYEPATATAVMRNIVLYAAVGGKFPKPVTQPTTQPGTQPAAQPGTQPAAGAATQPAAPATSQPAPPAEPQPVPPAGK